MARKLLPYSLLVLTASVVAMVFARINKQDFYHHYFRVIGEVETRNSQELSLPSVVEWSAVAPQEVLRLAVQWLAAVLAGIWVLRLLFSPTLPSRPGWRPPRTGARLFYRLHPIHGP